MPFAPAAFRNKVCPLLLPPLILHSSPPQNSVLINQEPPHSRIRRFPPFLQSSSSLKASVACSPSPCVRAPYSPTKPAPPQPVPGPAPGSLSHTLPHSKSPVRGLLVLWVLRHFLGWISLQSTPLDNLVVGLSYLGFCLYFPFYLYWHPLSPLHCEIWCSELSTCFFMFFNLMKRILKAARLRNHHDYAHPSRCAWPVGVASQGHSWCFHHWCHVESTCMVFYLLWTLLSAELFKEDRDLGNKNSSDFKY